MDAVLATKIERVESVVSAFFDIDLKDVYSRDRKRSTSNARAFIWFILHYDVGLSSSEIAKIYNRTRRNVFLQLSAIKFLIENQTQEHDDYLSISEIIIKNEEARQSELDSPLPHNREK